MSAQEISDTAYERLTGGRRVRGAPTSGALSTSVFIALGQFMRDQLCQIV